MANAGSGMGTAGTAFKPSMTIVGNLDTSDIDKGIIRVGAGFDGLKGKSKSFTSDLARMTSEAGSLVIKLSELAAVGTGAMIALVKDAPAVAPALANMGVSMFQLSKTLGEALQPAFEKVSNAFSSFVGFISDHKESISYFTDTIIGGLIDGLSGLRSAWTWISDNVKSFAATIGINFDLGQVGNYILQHYGAEAAAALIVGGAGAGVGMMVGGPAGAATGATIGAAVGAVGMWAGRRVNDPGMFLQEQYPMTMAMLQYFSQIMDRKQQTMNVTDYMYG